MRPFLTVLFLCFLSIPAMAAPHDLVIKVNGLVCDFCAQSIKHMFGKQDGVTDVSVDLDNGTVLVDLKDGQTIPDDTIAKIITDSGFSIVDIARTSQ